jgi:hypothetical protein
MDKGLEASVPCTTILFLKMKLGMDLETLLTNYLLRKKPEINLAWNILHSYNWRSGKLFPILRTINAAS